MRDCSKCAVPKPEDAFYVDARLKSGLRADCKECTLAHKRANRAAINARRNEHRKNTPGVRKADVTRWRFRRFGITEAEFQVMLAAQGHACAICRSVDPGDRDWCVDHDHSCCAGIKTCGQCVRGLLCSGCNKMLGFARDDTLVLRSALAYLEQGA